jgi:hypothetical protein
VQAPLAAHLVLEMLDCIRHVNVAARDLRFLQSAIEHLARRTHERLAAQILAVTWLLTDQHQARTRRSLTGHNLRCELI